MVSFSFKVVAALAAAAAVQANMEHELEVRDWEARRLAPRNFELITTKVTMLVPKGSYKTVTKYKTVTVTGDCGGGGITTDPITTTTGTTITDTFPTPTTSTDTTIPTLTDTAIPTGTDTTIPTATDTTIPTGTIPTGTDTLTAAPVPTPTDTTGIPGGNTTTADPGATLTGPPIFGGNSTTDPLATPTSPTIDPLAGTNATLAADPLATTTGVDPLAAITGDPLGTTTAADPLATGITTPADPAASLDLFGASTDTVVVTITSDPTAPTPTAPSIVKRIAQVI